VRICVDLFPNDMSEELLNYAAFGEQVVSTEDNVARLRRETVRQSFKQSNNEAKSPIADVYGAAGLKRLQEEWDDPTLLEHADCALRTSSNRLRELKYSRVANLKRFKGYYTGYRIVELLELDFRTFHPQRRDLHKEVRR